MSSTLSPRAKSVIAALVAIVVTAITTYQSVSNGGKFQWIDVVPVAVAVVSAISVHLIPNVPELPWAKTVVAVGGAVLGAVSTLVTSDPTGVSFSKISVVVIGAFLTWFVPEAGPDLADVVSDVTNQTVAVDSGKHAAAPVSVNINASAAPAAAALAAASTMTISDVAGPATQPLPAVQ